MLFSFRELYSYYLWHDAQKIVFGSMRRSVWRVTCGMRESLRLIYKMKFVIHFVISESITTSPNEITKCRNWILHIFYVLFSNKPIDLFWRPNILRVEEDDEAYSIFYFILLYYVNYYSIVKATTRSNLHPKSAV